MLLFFPEELLLNVLSEALRFIRILRPLLSDPHMRGKAKSVSFQTVSNGLNMIKIGPLKYKFTLKCITYGFMAGISSFVWTHTVRHISFIENKTLLRLAASVDLISFSSPSP